MNKLLVNEREETTSNKPNRYELAIEQAIRNHESMDRARKAVNKMMEELRAKK